MNILVIDAGKLTDWLSLLVSTLAFTSGIILLYLTWRNLVALVAQARSQSKHQVVEAHKTLFMPLIQDAQLAELAIGSDTTTFRKRMLASMMINHAGRIFNEFETGVRAKSEINSFKRDVRDLFSIPIVSSRWPEVKDFHSPRFGSFLDEAISNPPSQAVNPSTDVESIIEDQVVVNPPPRLGLQHAE